jgi:hypothetical protein
MKKIGWFSRLSNQHQQPSPARIQRIAGGIGVAILLMTGSAVAQNPTPDAPLPTPESQIAAPQGYAIHQTVDLGGHIVGLSGSGAMYSTLVNIQSGPRVLGETFEMRALPGNKHTLIDTLSAFGTGFGGDPNSFSKLDASKGKIYDFSGTFRRDRQYFDYDLLGNPNITTGQSIPIGPSNAPTGSLAWPQVNQSSVMFNTVRRMMDTSLTLFPLSTLTYRVAYSHNIFQGPTQSPSYNIAKYNALLAEYQRNSTDDFTGAVDWKPLRETKLSFEEQVDHYKADSYFTLAPNGFLVQEADGTPAYLGNWDSQTAYGIAGCNTGSMGSAYTNATTYTILSKAQTQGGLPIINPACDVVTSYMRSQPTRILYPTESFLLQSSSIKNISMNGAFRYTKANMNLPNYNENFQGLDGAATSIAYTAIASAKREVVSADYGIVWQAMRTVTLADQVDYSDVHQPGTATYTNKTTLSTPITVVAGNNGFETINYSGPLTTTNATATSGSPFTGSNAVTVPLPAYFGQKFLTNNLTGSWEASSRATLSLTYRYRTHTIIEGLNGVADNAPLAPGQDNNGTVTINENGGIFNAALRPTSRWELNGTVEALYDDNAFTPVGPRQTRHYRAHTRYRPKPWATISGAYNDLERHNNTNNNQSAVALGTASGGVPFLGPLDHVDHSRIASTGVVLTPNEHYGFDFNYAYSDVYMASNICYLNGATATLPGAATAPGASLPNSPYVAANGACATKAVATGTTPSYTDWFARDFMDAPTQYVSMALSMTPNKTIHSDIGYRISDVNGSRFFNDARDVNGSLVSKYQSPFVKLAWTVRPGWIWKAEYNYFSYGEGGPSGSPYCSNATTATATIVPCNSATISAYPTGLTEPTSGLTAPRNFHANNVTVSMHYEF